MRLRSSRFVRLAVLAAMLPALGGCGARTDRAAAEADPTTRAQALIEAGNLAYRSGDYELAARRFGAAAVIDKDDAAAYYGLGMALTRLGRDEDARVAYGRARRLTQEQALKDMDQAARADSLAETQP